MMAMLSKRLPSFADGLTNSGDFYETHPDIYFYLAGELPKDELGESAGIIARPPKRSFKAIRDLDDASFAV